MRRTHDKADRTKKFMVYFMGFVMVASVFGVIFFGFNQGGVTTSLNYNGFEFLNRGNLWVTNINKIPAFFTYYPSDVELINVENSAIDKLRGAIEIDTTSDFNDTLAEGIALAQFQMGSTLQNFNVFVFNGFTSENPQNAPVITCNKSTQQVPVVYFRSSNATKIFLDNNCVIGEASNQADMIRLKDRIVYGIFGIIK